MNRFDQLTRFWTRHAGSRRQALALLAASALGIAAGQTQRSASAGKKQRCIHTNKTCDPQGGPLCCDGGRGIDDDRVPA